MILQHRRAHWMLPGYALLPISLASRVYVCFLCYCSTRILSWYALNYSGVSSWTTYLRSSHTCSSAFNNYGLITIGYTTLTHYDHVSFLALSCCAKIVVSSYYYMLIYTCLIVFIVIIQLLNWILSQTVNPFQPAYLFGQPAIWRCIVYPIALDSQRLSEIFKEIHIFSH